MESFTMGEFSGGGDRLSRLSAGLDTPGGFPMQAIHVVGRFGRLLSVYALYQYLMGGKSSVVVFTFGTLLGSTIIFFAIQKPWKGRPLSQSQLVPTLINGGVLALSLVLWGKGLRACGPVRTVLAEYVGAVLGAISTLLFGRGGHVQRKIGGLIAMLAAFYFLSQGWAMATFSPFSFKSNSTSEGSGYEKGHVGLQSMIVPIVSGLLAALRRIIARRVSLKSRSKKRFHAITVAAATCFLFPFAIVNLALGDSGSKSENHGLAVVPYLITIFFGTVMIYYVDAFVEDKLQVLPSSPQHLLVTGFCLIILEFLYRMDFSFLGFLWCLAWLGSGIYAATILDKFRREVDQGEGDFLRESRSELALSSLPS
ncbi:unnamed protein product [Calypogeia fissa]